MKTVLLFVFIMSADMHSLRFHLIELPRIPAYYPKTCKKNSNTYSNLQLKNSRKYFRSFSFRRSYIKGDVPVCA